MLFFLNLYSRRFIKYWIRYTGVQQRKPDSSSSSRWTLRCFQAQRLYSQHFVTLLKQSFIIHQRKVEYHCQSFYTVRKSRKLNFSTFQLWKSLTKQIRV